MVNARSRCGLAAAIVLAGGAAATAQQAQPAEQFVPNAGMLRFADVSETQIVFTYANDLWLASREGGAASPLASPAGAEGFARFSPDGRTIAFMGNYEGDRDIYTIPVTGGIPHRVTHHPGNEVLCDWTPDGRILFSTNGMAGQGRQQQLFVVDADGGLPEKLPVPYGAAGAISPDGKWLAYTPHNRDFRTWKRYRGGLASDIWLFNLEDYTSRQITDWEGTDTQPMWLGDTVYYLSDAGPNHRLNIWSFNTTSGDRRQITEFADYDVKWPSMGPGQRDRGEIIFENGSDLHLLDLRRGRTQQVEISIPGARPTLREKEINAGRFLQGGDVSATGKRMALEARGDIWSVPAEKGITRNLTDTDGVAERNPMWSPDGRWIAYLSDATGEYEIYVTQSDGRGETRQLTSDGTMYRTLGPWSPDSKSLIHMDKSGRIFLLDIESGASTLVATDTQAAQPRISWSHDSKWLTFTLSDPENLFSSIVHLYDIENAALHAVTSGMFTAISPTFDRKGDFLYYVTNMNFTPTYDDFGRTWVYRQTGVLHAVPLNSEVEDPWAPEPDEEEWDEEEEEEESDDAEGNDDDDAEEGDDEETEEEDEEADEPKSAIHGVWSGTLSGLAAMGAPEDSVPFTMTIVDGGDGSFYGSSEAMGQSDSFDSVTFDEDTGAFEARSSEQGIESVLTGTLEGDTISGDWEIPAMGIKGTWEATKTDEEVDEDAAGDKDEAKPVVIDLEGFEARAMALPVDPGVLAQLSVNDKNQVIYLRVEPSGLPSLKLFDIEKPDDGEKNVVSGIGFYVMSGDGKKIGAIGAGGPAIISAAPGQSLAKTIPMGAMTKMVDPRAEWRQILNEAWRLHRDFFYDPNMHGVDWPAVRERYMAMVDDVASREDLSFVIGEMISELNVGHAYNFGGDLEREPSRNVGMLGADFELVTTDEGTAYRIAKIHEGGPWDSDARGPISRHGVDVKEGDFLLAVNGRNMDTSKDPWAAFIGTAGDMTELTVSDKPVMDDEARRVYVEPLSSESNLRFRSWIENTRRVVEEKSNGRIGYIYVVNTGVPGQNDLVRQFMGQRGKDALIIDDRWNGGGQIPDRFIELLNRPISNYWALRDGQDWQWPPEAHNGPKAMLANGPAGSGGDMFPALFKAAGLGPVIGTRTWGGLVGISGGPPFIDGGATTAPSFAFYETDGTWGIEGHGVDPDIEVIDNPSLMVDGGDPQLDAAIEWLMAELERNPPRRPERPAYPDRSGMGIEESDK